MLSIQDYAEDVKTNLEDIGDSPPRWYCGTWGVLNTETGKSLPFFCGSARCVRPECRRKFWWKRVQRIQRAGAFLHMPPDRPAKFFTLTYPTTMTFDGWWEPWRKFRYVIGRKYGYFSYLAVLEKHRENDRPHIHGITSLWLPQEEWSTRWVAVGGGPVVDIRVVRDEAFADYFAKDYGVAGYFGKDNMTQAYVRQRRRTIFASRDVTAWEKEQRRQAPSSPWMMIQAPIYKDGINVLTNGASVVYTKDVGKYLIKLGCNPR